MKNSVPDIEFHTVPGYAALIAHNWDSVQEAFKVGIPEELAARLEKGKQEAIEKHEGQGSLFSFGGQWFQIWAGASQGNKWVLEDDDIQIHFGPPARDWPVTVRYLSAGLWEHGFQAVKDRVVGLLEKECIPAGDEPRRLSDWCHVSRADYAFDFYSPKFTAEMNAKRVRENVLATSGVKIGVVGPSTHDETLTIGMCRAGLVIQVYNKGTEITEASGKTWMFKVWEREGYYPPDDQKAKDVWRVEIRFGKEFLKDRNIRTFEALQNHISELIADAIFRRRLVKKNKRDANKARWPLHPLWAEVYEASGKAGNYLPVGRQITMRRQAYSEMLMKQEAGVQRARSVLYYGHYNKAYVAAASHEAMNHALEDERHKEKVAKCVERQRYIDEAK
jgi:hypothetical protein